MAKCKELLAYLVDKAGRRDAGDFAALWEGRVYDRKMQKQLDVYIRSLRATLREHGAEEMLEMHKNDPCPPRDLYLRRLSFQRGDPGL